MPKRVAGINLRSLPIGPTEAFVFSRVDSRATVPQLVRATGLAMDDVLEALRQLARVGAIVEEACRGARSAQPDRRTPSASSPTLNERAAKESTDNPSGAAEFVAEPGASAKSQESAAAGPKPELDQQTRVRIDDLLQACDRVDYYRLLGVPRSANKREIKQAYYAAVGEFHPDRFFGKELGDYKQKAERAVTLLTRAHDTLTRKKRRADYDATLVVDEETPEAPSEPSTSSVGGTASPARQLSPNSTICAATPPPNAPSACISSAAPPGSRPPQAQCHASTPPSRQTPKWSMRPSIHPRADAARRELLARKLGGSIRPLARAKSSDSSPAQRERSSFPNAADRPHHAGSRSQLYSERAQAALNDGNVIAAANSFRLAHALAPQDDQLKERLEQAESLVDRLNFGKHLAEANKAKAQGDFPRAARSFSRAARGKSLIPASRDESAELYLEAADCARTGCQDLKLAREYAKQAVFVNPEGAREHFALGQIYAEAGMQSSALSELQLARKLCPNDPNIELWLKRLSRGDV